MNIILRAIQVIATSSAALLLFLSTAPAATKYWDVDTAANLQGGNGTWDTGTTASWSTSTGGSNPLVTWADGDSAEFRTTIAPLSYTNTISGSVNVFSINKGSNNRVVLTGGTLRIGAGGMINDEGGETKALVVESPVVLAANQEWRVKWSSPSIIRVSGNIGEDASGTKLTLARSAGGAGGRFELSGTGTYSGGTILNGTNVEVWVSSADAFGTGPITLDAAILMNKAALTITNDIVIGPNAPLANPGSLDFSVGDLTFSGDVSGVGTMLIKNVDNTKTLTLSGDNSAFTGTWNASKGTVRFGSPDAGSASATWAIGHNGARLDFGGGTLHLGALNSLSQYAHIEPILNSGNYTLLVGEKDIDCSFTAELRYIGGTSLAVEKRGSATFTISGSANSFRGGVTAKSGVLAFATLTDNWGGNSSLGPTGPIVLDGGALRYIGTGHASNRGLTLGLDGGTLDASGSGAIAYTATSISLPTGGARTLTLSGTSAAANTLAAKLVDDGANPTSLTKTGAGSWILTAANTYTGATTVDGGCLFVDGSLAAGSAVGVTAQGVLGGTGTVNGTATASDGGCVTGGKNGAGTTTLKQLVIGEGGAIGIQMGAEGVCGLIRIPSDGALTLQDFAVAVGFLDGYALEGPGVKFGLVQNETAGAIDISALEFQEGALVYDGGDLGLRVTYTGNIAESGVTGRGTGNDIVLYSAYPKAGTLVVVK